MKKSLIILIAAVLILALGAATTIAWFTSIKSLTNTFTVGKVDITLTEPDWDAETDTLLVPGKALTKDPTVTVLDGSEDCYVFVKIETKALLDGVIAYEIADGWIELTAYPDVYWQTVLKTETPKELQVLKDDEVTVPTDIIGSQLNGILPSDNTMTITAYAIQSAYLSDSGGSVTDAEGAWEILFPTP